ncbi:M10 family metallopeptidase C-terminal domain-containing protein [Arsenophonus sp.]|uniref:M10 family metallopeptidase C-terminal domain-containing protein n=1 Tax=Arsenophonus sp. TaxID=1872640 RepID=UPI0038792F53
MSNNYISNDVNNWYSDNKKPQKLDNGSGKDTFVFSSIKDSPYDNPDKIMDFETGIDKIDLSAIRLNSYSTSNPDLYFVDSFTKLAGDVMLTYNPESNLSQLLLDGDGDAIPDFGLHILGVVEQSDLILA